MVYTVENDGKAAGDKMTEENSLPISRERLINEVSKNFIEIRKETKLTQDEMANVLGVSKNTILNAEKCDRPLSWAVVMAATLLFSQTETMKKIIKGESPLEIITRCALLENDKAKNSVLYNSTLASLGAGITAGLMSSGVLSSLAGGILGAVLGGRIDGNPPKK